VRRQAERDAALKAAYPFVFESGVTATAVQDGKRSLPASHKILIFRRVHDAVLIVIFFDIFCEPR